MVADLTRSTLFPYTTLFRSCSASRSVEPPRRTRSRSSPARAHRSREHRRSRWWSAPRIDAPEPVTISNVRSEEHTSELQSHSDLVCRLLVEKKKLHQPAMEP